MTEKTIRDLILASKALHRDALCDIELEGLSPNAEQFYWLALASLNQAIAYLELSDLAQAKALAER